MTLVFFLVLVPVTIHLAYLVWLRLAPDDTPGASQSGADADWPSVDILVPTLDEEAFIAQKLENLQRLAYPRHLLSITILDGGSTDRTLDLAAAAASAASGATAEPLCRGMFSRGMSGGGTFGSGTFVGGPRIDIVRTGLRGKAAQLNAGFARATADFILVTDADARLESDALTRLIAAARADENIAVVGVPISPAAGDTHPAEQLHWRLLNWMHRQEARRGSAAIVTGPCYLMRRGIIARIPDGVVADDVFVSYSAAAKGFRVGWVETPVIELRAPRTAREMLQYRRRRGAAYLREVMRFLPRTPGMRPPARGIFLWRAALLLTVPFGGAALAVLCLLAAAAFMTLPPSSAKQAPKQEAVP